jgi:hypothetical protein
MTTRSAVRKISPASIHRFRTSVSPVECAAQAGRTVASCRDRQLDKFADNTQG